MICKNCRSIVQIDSHISKPYIKGDEMVHLELCEKDANLLHEVLDERLVHLEDRLKHFQFLDTYDNERFPRKLEKTLEDKIERIHDIEIHLEEAMKQSA